MKLLDHSVIETLEWWFRERQIFGGTDENRPLGWRLCFKENFLASNKHDSESFLGHPLVVRILLPESSQ
ncbi:MAG: hypothetical protein DME33_05550 [Verrucomicrobia bacterium]|nr:MAG: hypothetical protein DME33_05550 [Verrucomicrobiota bacterium]